MLDKSLFPDDFESAYVDGKTWQVMQSFRFIDPEFGVITVPEGFLTDYASIPRLFWSVVGSPENYAPAATVHDYLYRGWVLKRKKADDVFLRAMLASGISKRIAYTFYSAVRLFGWINY